MIDETSESGRIIAAALRLAAGRPWAEVTLADIAAGAGIGLVDVKRSFASKGRILAAFTRLVDDEMLRRAPRRQPSQSARDALFEVVMSRLDVLSPYKAALRSITGPGLPDPELLRPLFTAQAWMLEAAGIGSGGSRGAVRALGLGSVYASVFRTWLDDSEPGNARTMAALDRRLRRGERAISRVEEACAGLNRLACALMPGVFRRRGGPPSAAPSAPPGGGGAT